MEHCSTVSGSPDSTINDGATAVSLPGYEELENAIALLYNNKGVRGQWITA